MLTSDLESPRDVALTARTRESNDQRAAALDSGDAPGPVTRISVASGLDDVFACVRFDDASKNGVDVQTLMYAPSTA